MPFKLQKLDKPEDPFSKLETLDSGFSQLSREHSASYLACDFFPRAISFRAPGEFVWYNQRVDGSCQTEPSADEAKFLRSTKSFVLTRNARLYEVGSQRASSSTLNDRLAQDLLTGEIKWPVRTSDYLIRDITDEDGATTLPRASVLNNRGRDIPSRFEISSPLVSPTILTVHFLHAQDQA